MDIKKVKPPAQKYLGAERILGVYPQRQDGLFFQRIRILGGRISWVQWRKVIEICGRYSQGSAIHITTRQDIELHNIAGADIKVVQDELASAGLITKGAGGDGIRNITVCTGCNPELADIFDIAKFVNDYVAALSLNLPRKFKISFSGCIQNCAKPWINDIGFVLQQDGFFTVIGGGSLGPRPAAGILLYKDIAPKDILPLCLAALELFEKEGDRENRNRARLRHLREKIGNEKFKTEIAVRFARIKSSQKWPDVSLKTNSHNIKLLHKLQLPNGNINIKDAEILSDVAEEQKAEIRINLEQGIELYGLKNFPLPDSLAKLKNLPVIICCPGNSSCSKGLTNTWALADEIRKYLSGIDTRKLRINISGCPNGCGQSSAANIGLIGMRRIREGRSDECYRIVTGGHNGTDDCLAKGVDVIFSEDTATLVGDLLSSPTQ